MTARLMILLGAALLPGLACADDLRWTNTVRLSTLYQFNKVPPLAEDDCSSGLNCGYGADFTQGRADWLSELDWSRTDYGLHASLEARKDAVEPASSFINPFEAYLHGTFDLLGRPLTAAIGRQSVIWGESLSFAANGIAGAQAPIDFTGGVDATGYATAHFLPVGQASVSWQLGGEVTLLAYQQFEWRRNRVDPEDAYAAAGDVLGDDHLSRINVYNPEYGPISYRRRDVTAAPSGTDQFGLGLKFRHDEWDLGLYALQFDAKMPDVFYYRGVHTYGLHYAEGAALLGASLAGAVGDATIGAEVSARRHTQLVQGGIFLEPGQDAREIGPRGDTLEGQISVTLPIAPIALLPGGASWTSELAANHLLAVTANSDQFAPGRSRDAAALRTTLTANFYQVLPRIDLSVPLGLGWNFAGSSALLPEMNRGTGDISLGVAATFDHGWTASLTGTHYFGEDRIPIPGYAGHSLSDWDRLAASVQYSF
ncbi:MAG TPA: DUF1302 family protein [Magnetospirillaceae bacterium]|nr:DUF1302 family protein [Magnetospirillaceae bacterium]